MPEPRPLAEVLVATTWRCNLKCSYCFVRHRGLSAAGGAMSPALAARSVDALDEGLTHVESIRLHLYGGEPLTNLPALEAMLARARQKRPGRFCFAVSTNGAGAAPQALDLLESGGFQVVLSIDGPAEIHDQCRRTAAGGPTHATVLRFLEGLRSRTRCWVEGSAVVRPGWRLSQASAYLRSLPVDSIKAQAARVPADSPYALGPAERAAYLLDLEAAGSEVIGELEAGLVPRDDRFTSRVLQMLQGSRRRSFCGAGRTTFGLAPDGTVLPCVLLDRATSRLGHVNDSPAAWVEAGLKWQSARQLRAQCRACPALDLCGGGCPALTPLCGDEECEVIRKNCEVARGIYERFRETPEVLLGLVGIT